MGSRAQLAARLTLELPDAGWLVIDKARTIDPPSTDIVAILAVQRLKVEPAPNARGSYLETFSLWLIEPSSDIEQIDDNLDEHLEILHDALDKLPWLSWQESTRDLYDDTYHAYRVEVQIPTQKD